MEEVNQQDLPSFYYKNQNDTYGDKIMRVVVATSFVIGSFTLSHSLDYVEGSCVDVDNRDILPAFNIPICLEIAGLENDFPIIGR